jgi:hypothetical protein
MAYTRLNLGVARTREHAYWILRRANAGLFTGFVAWFFIPALSRSLSQAVAPWVHFLMTGLLGGAFLGTVDGMVEESTPKTIRGAILGGAGGALGGVIFGNINQDLSAPQIIAGLFGFWGLAGALIGLVSAWWERKPRKNIIGALAGFIGGGIGGALCYALYFTLVQEFHPEHWLLRRLFESISGAVTGVSLWFAIGIAERFVIFRRRTIEDKTYKHCDYCNENNPLKAWYCGKCGSVLQQAALATNLNLSAFVTLDRLRAMFRFLSRLSATTGVIGGLVVFLVFLNADILLAFVILIVVEILSYCLLIFFAALSESLQIFIKKT